MPWKLNDQERNPMPRFAILYHDQIEKPHWDLMLEHKKHLATWQVASNPQIWPSAPLTCTKIFDHRKKYLDYEGPLSAGSGEVQQIETGYYTSRIITDILWKVMLKSEDLNGMLLLSHIIDDQWQLHFE